MSIVDTIRDVSPLDGPYIGLNFYTEENAAIFFGRDNERTVLISNLRAARLTLLYAKSGTGKSSLLRAGAAARLTELAQRSFSQRGTARNIPVVFSSWRDDPTAELIGEIHEAISPFRRAASPPAPAPAPAPAPDGLETAIEAANRATDATLLVILDQFEEYRLYRSGEFRDPPFADELAACINRTDLRANFLISIRDDAYFGLGDLFKGRVSNVYGNYFHLEHLTREATREAIEKPIARFNDLHRDQAPVQIEPDLVDAVLDQLALDQDGAGRHAGGNGAVPRRDEIHAPYLQLVMKWLWDVERSNGSRKLRLQTLVGLGGARAIVGSHVDRALGGLSDEERDAAAAILHYLVTPSRTKIALAASDLAEYTARPADETSALLQRLASSDTRILRPVPPPPGRPDGTRFEISHDLLAPAILRWDRRQAAVRLEREKAAAEQRARAERRRALRFRTLAIAACLIAAIAVAATIATVGALSGERAAVSGQHVAQSEQMAAEAMDLLPANARLAMLLSLQGYETAPTLQAESALILAVQPPLHGPSTTGGPGERVAFSPDGRILAVGDSVGHVVLWDATTGRRTATLPDGSPVTSLAFSPDARILAVGDSVGHVVLWDAATGRQTAASLAETGPVSSVAFSPDGRTLAIGDSVGQVRLQNVAAGLIVSVLTEGSPVSSVAFSPDGRTLAVGDTSGDAGLWNVATNQPTVSILAEGSPVTSVAFSPDGQRLAVGDTSGHAGLWNVATRQRTAALTDGAPVTSIAFSPDGQGLAVGDSLGTVGIWNAASGQQLAMLSLAKLTKDGAVASLAFSSRDSILAVGGLNGGIQLWQNLANLTQRQLTQLICGRVQGNMTPAQWARYVPGQPYRQTCP